MIGQLIHDMVDKAITRAADPVLQVQGQIAHNTRRKHDLKAQKNAARRKLQRIKAQLKELE